MEAGKRLSVFFLIMVILVIGFLIVVNDLNKIAEFKCVDNELFKEGLFTIQDIITPIDITIPYFHLVFENKIRDINIELLRRN